MDLTYILFNSYNNFLYYYYYMKQPIYIDNTTAQNKIINSTGNQIIMTLPLAINLDRNIT